MLRLFGITLTADHIISPHNRDTSAQQVQTPLSPTVKIFSQIVFQCSKCKYNFPHFEIKDQPHGSNYLEVIDSEKSGYFNARKLLF